MQVASTDAAPDASPPTYTPDGAFATQVLLNPDANAPLVKNGDGTGPLTDTAIDNVGNVVLSNAVLTNNVLSNNALTNNVLSNNALTNAVLSNVVLSNAVLSNLDPQNAALSNNASVEQRADQRRAVERRAVQRRAVEQRAVERGAVERRPVEQRAQCRADQPRPGERRALQRRAVEQRADQRRPVEPRPEQRAVQRDADQQRADQRGAVQRRAVEQRAVQQRAVEQRRCPYVALSNAPLGDGANGGDPEALSTIETGAVEIAKNAFQTGDLANSNFKETTFTIRNRGNIDTTIALKLMLRDAVCTARPLCTPPVDAPATRLQAAARAAQGRAGAGRDSADRARRVHRTGHPHRDRAGEHGGVERLRPAADRSRATRTSGSSCPDDPNAAMLSLAAGEYAYATIRAIGVGGATPPDPADLLQWGVKTVATNATSANGPLVIRTLNFPAAPPSSRSTPRRPTFRTFGGNGPDHRRQRSARTGRQRGAERRRRAGLQSRRARELLHRHGGADALRAEDVERVGRRHSADRQRSQRAAGERAMPTGCDRDGGVHDRRVVQQHGHGDVHAEVLGRLLHAGQRRRRERAAADGPPGDQGHRPAAAAGAHVRPAIPATLTYNTGINLRPLVSSDSKNGASPFRSPSSSPRPGRATWRTPTTSPSTGRRFRSPVRRIASSPCTRTATKSTRRSRTRRRSSSTARRRRSRSARCRSTTS